MLNLHEAWAVLEPPVLNFDEIVPSFYFKGENSFKDHACYIENDLNEGQATKLVDSIKVAGKSGRLHRTLGDYDSFDYSIELQLVDFEKVERTKRWLTGTGKLILSTDRNKYRIATVKSTGVPVVFTNLMNTYWKFTVTFELEPFKRSLQSEIIEIEEGKKTIINAGMEIAFPYFELNSKGGEVKIVVNGREFRMKDTQAGKIIVDGERKVVTQNNRFVKKLGDFPYCEPLNTYEGHTGANEWVFQGINKSYMDRRTVWL